MFGIKLFNKYNKVKHILVKPKIKVMFGRWIDQPFRFYNLNLTISLFTKHRVLNKETYKYEFSEDFQKKLNKWKLGWVKPTIHLPWWMGFGILNTDYYCKWKYDVACFESKPCFSIIVFGYALSFYLDVPFCNLKDFYHESTFYEFIEEYLSGENHNNLFKCIKMNGYSTIHTKGSEFKIRTLPVGWFKPEVQCVYDAAYESIDEENRTIDKSEWILCAATKRKEMRKVETNPYHPGTNDILNVELGYRHHDIFRRFNDGEDEEIDTGMYAQGFFTSKGRWVSRKEAAEIAYAAGQIKEKVRNLTSEDLY